MSTRFIAINMDDILDSDGKFIKEFQKFFDKANCEISLYQDAYDKLISEVLLEATESYFDSGDNVYSGDVIEVLSRIWADKEQYAKIKKMMLHHLFETLIEYEKEL